MSPAFYELHTQIKTQRPHTVVCKGGRGSTKSSFMSVEFILFLLQHPQCHGVVLRKIANTLRNSVYAQIQWAIGALGLQDMFPVYGVPHGDHVSAHGPEDPFFWSG